MLDSRDSDGPLAAIAVVVVIALLAGGAATFFWQRQQSRVQRTLAVVEAERARAVAEHRLAEATQSDLTVPSHPSGIIGNPESIEASIREVLQTQQRAWNAGDIDRFMESYWKSDDLTFSSGGKLTRTWRDTLERYKHKYPSQSDMGTLSFQNLEVTPLGMDAALVLGDWQLSRDSQKSGGNFTLVFRRLGDEWVIVHDHTSSIEQR